MFKGVSTLRAGEKKEQPLSEKAKALQQYLAAQYGAGDADKKKKKKKKRPEAAGPGIKILDQDVSGFATAAASAKRGPPLAGGDADGAEEDEPEEDQPVVVNVEEGERLKLVAERERNFFKQGNDGSGWAVADSTAAADASPPRRQRHDSPDASPPRRQRHDSPDASPPRRQRHNSPDASPPRRQRHDSPDASPPRRQRRDSPDASPPRRPAAAADRDSSQPRRGGGADSDASPPRRQSGAADADASPPRKRRAGESATGEEESAEAKKRRMMSDGTIAGMVSGRELVAEMQRKREREKQRFAELEADVTGRGAQTVFRDKEGRQVSKEAYLEEKAAAKKKAQYDSEQQLDWGGGLKQRVDASQRVAEMAAEAAKPFARSRDDRELDAMHRGRSRWGDPMAGLVASKIPDLEAPASLVEKHAEQMKKSSGFIIPQEVPKHSWLRRGLGPPPNRYGIRPGRHWDGVDRSNGFERDMFKRQTELKRRDQEARMWAQEDM